jgi:hypothetical protein
VARNIAERINEAFNDNRAYRQIIARKLRAVEAANDRLRAKLILQELGETEGDVRKQVVQIIRSERLQQDKDGEFVLGNSDKEEEGDLLDKQKREQARKKKVFSGPARPGPRYSSTLMPMLRSSVSRPPDSPSTYEPFEKVKVKARLLIGSISIKHPIRRRKQSKATGAKAKDKGEQRAGDPVLGTDADQVIGEGALAPISLADFQKWFDYYYGNNEREIKRWDNNKTPIEIWGLIALESDFLIVNPLTISGKRNNIRFSLTHNIVFTLEERYTFYNR